MYYVVHNPGKVMPLRDNSGDVVATRMYSGLAQNQQQQNGGPNSTTTYPSAPPAYYDND